MKELSPLKFIQNMESEPYVLFVGDSFDITNAENRDILKLPWSCIITSQKSDNAKFASAFNIPALRMVVYVDQKEQLNSRAMDRKNLKIVRLFNDEDDARQTKAFGKLEKISEILALSGTLVVIGYTCHDLLKVDKMVDFLYSLRTYSTIIFDPDGDLFNNKEFIPVIEKQTCIQIKDNIRSYLTPVLPEAEEIREEDFLIDEEKNIYFYVNDKKISLPKKDIFEVSRFAKLLNIYEIKNVQVPNYLYEGYFYNFLKESPYEPQWYGYEHGFNLNRSFEDELFNRVLNGLKNPGKLRLKPICVYGQSGSSKSIALANLAYKVFMDRQFPVVYINNPRINFNSNFKSDDGLGKLYPSQYFILLEELLKKLTELGAESVLVIWDLSAASIFERERCINLFDKLRNRGRNLQIVFTSYAVSNDFGGDEDLLTTDDNMKLTGENGTKRCYYIQSDKNLTSKEVQDFRTILHRKARMQRAEIDSIFNKISMYSNIDGTLNSNIFVVFYWVFYDLRKLFEQGIKKEAITTIDGIMDEINEPQKFMLNAIQAAFYEKLDIKGKEQFEKKVDENLRKNIDNLLITIAVCSQFNLVVPSDLAYRLLPSINYRLINKIAKIPFFDYREYEYGDFAFKIRTKLEAEMLLRAYNVTSEREISLIINMLDILRSHDEINHDSEVDLMVNILKNVGPNSSQFSKSNNEFSSYYLRIIKALSEFREKGGNPRLTLQEIVYMREYACDTYKRSMQSKDDEKDYVKLLEEAIRIGESERATLVRSNITSGAMYHDLNIEIANSRMRLSEVLPSAIGIEYCQRAQEEAIEVISQNPDSSYAYSILLWAACKEYNLLGNNIERAMILAKYADIIDRVRSEHPEIASESYFYAPATELYNHLDDTKMSEEYFTELLKRGSSAGIYFKVRQILSEAGINIYKGNKDITDDQVIICKNICTKYLENPVFMNVTLQKQECQQLRLRLKWLIYDRQPIFNNLEQTTKITREGWQDLLNICLNYKNYFYDTNQVEFYTASTVLYVLALCYAQLDDFENCLGIVDLISQETSNLIFQYRLIVRHILCDEHGKPLKFEGEFVPDTVPQIDRGYVKIYKIHKEWNHGKTGIQYKKYNMKNTQCEPGQYYDDFNLGLGFARLSVYRKG